MKTLLPVAVVLALTACAVTAPIQPAADSKSGFDGTMYEGRIVTVGRATPGATQYRVFQQGASGVVSINSVREDAEKRAIDFCDRKDKAMEPVTETTSPPDAAPGNFPRVEIVFDCVDKASPPSAVPTAADKDAMLQRLKNLLDTGVLTQAEYDREKAKLLGAQ